MIRQDRNHKLKKVLLLNMILVHTFADVLKIFGANREYSNAYLLARGLKPLKLSEAAVCPAANPTLGSGGL